MQCPRCKGEGLCAECQGSGSIECLSCAGQGTRKTSRGASYDCKTCSGSGKIDCPKECSSCNGSGVITEELQKETRDKYRPKFANYTPTNAVTIPILVLNVLVFVGLQADESLGRWLLLSQHSLPDGHYWNLLTPSFVHFSIWHIVLNMTFLWVYGPILEGLLGKGRFIGLYVFTSLSASLVSWLGNIKLDGLYYAGVGASGPLYGLIGAMLALHLRWKMVPQDLVKRLVTWCAAFVVLGFAARGTAFDILDNWGHLGGFIGGFLLMSLLPRPRGH